MMIPQKVKAWIKENHYGELESSHSASGGCINNGIVLKTNSGKSLFLKTNSHAPENMFAREVEGLNALRVDDGPRVPQAYLYDNDFLLMEDLAPSQRLTTYWEDFGHQMAALHEHTSDTFGFVDDNYIGSTPQPNPSIIDGYHFFAQFRLVFQAEIAASKGLITPQETEKVSSLSNQLEEFIPEQPASLIHGDLWGGNAMADETGSPAIIDPAAHYGWAEPDLAMTALFGGFSDRFYSAYLESRPLPSGWRERFGLYNLYHLLNHLNLFGRGYYGQVIQILNRYV